MWKYFLAVKYLLSRPINLIGAVGVTLAVWALVLVISIFTGYIREMRLHIRGTASDLSFLFNHERNRYTEVEPLILADPAVRAVAPRLSWYGLIDPQRERKHDTNRIDPAATAGKPATNFFQVVGIDVARELALRDFRGEMLRVPVAEHEDRRVPDPEHPFALPPGLAGDPLPGILVGLSRADAEGWDLKRGDIVTLTSAQQAPRGDKELVYTINQRFVLTGVFTSRHHEFENSTVFVDIAVMRELLASTGRPADSFNEIAIALHDPGAAKEARDRLGKTLADADVEGRVFMWQERPRFARFLENVDHQRSLMTLVLGILLVVSCFLIFATLLMMVAEKTRDIGILAALGATRAGILVVFLLCGLVASTAGATLGMLSSWWSCRHLNDINDWLYLTFDLKLFPKDIYGLKEIPYELDPMWIGIVMGSAVVGTALFGLIPAILAARMDPVRALRRD